MATGAGENLFVDTNILVYATVASAPLHLQAKGVLVRNRKFGNKLWISRQVLREYLAVLSRPQTFTPALTLDALLDELLLIESSFYIAEDGPKVTEKLMSLLRKIPSFGKQIHDANIVATMLANNIPALITHNVTDYERFRGTIEIVALE
ncbi:MAG: PIN domain-containing protein [Pirellulales bacterium]|nr:PIN domain-containing protein [Pirellulales bacterium]